MANAYPRESVEFQPVNIMVEGTPVLTGLSFAVVPDGSRPVTFSPADMVGGRPGFYVGGFGPGTYRVFAQLENPPETPVIDCGYFYIN